MRTPVISIKVMLIQMLLSSYLYADISSNNAGKDRTYSYQKAQLTGAALAKAASNRAILEPPCQEVEDKKKSMTKEELAYDTARCYATLAQDKSEGRTAKYFQTMHTSNMHIVGTSTQPS